MQDDEFDSVTLFKRRACGTSTLQYNFFLRK